MRFPSDLCPSSGTGELSARSQVRWRLCWENELELADHAELAEFLRKAYNPSGTFNARPFEGGRSWAGARPEVRAIGYDSRGVAAHIAALRRFIKVGAVDLLVAELGLYAVRPDLEGLRISHSMLVMYPALKELGVPFGFGTVRHALQKHLTRLLGKAGLATIVSGVRVRSTLRDMRLDMPPTRVEDLLILVFPIGRPMSDWPAGTIIDRNGPEL
ncbi:NodA family N-acyltransferase [Methylobacterium nodulans]|uniref:Nodulation protein A n=2 Tax=Methylobacterium nodulans TaxID=114616 RepID=NODA_METNO|nr:NodA family N-acyltransferase [Methylobacterium nodulans]Q9F0C9.1 RecName: Full=Nodulation protein A [Methylobacterium nodulans ORS 2060]AAG49150.1 nodulation protein NodA [Methylobacterium nodulans ORS 2060]ACL58907.1 Nodulation protein A NodA [Methylobacterium nodulans ORS 2060]AEQ76836.1 putative acyltransferase [Methylobacterium nodulans]CAN84682.1 NodA protein [Methylobacterium nodulans ORS 2060]